MRSIALAQALKQDFDIYFAVQKPEFKILDILEKYNINVLSLPEASDFDTDCNNLLLYISAFDIVILDGYNFLSEYQRKIKQTGCQLVVIDDLHQGVYHADVIINPALNISPKDYKTTTTTTFFFGTDYALLRPAFLKAAKQKRIIKKTNTVFISMGGADIHNISQKALKTCLQINAIQEINIVIGAVNPHKKVIEDFISLDIEKNKKVYLHHALEEEKLCNLLQKCDLVICPASTLLIEACAVGIGIISGYSADNQLDILDGMEKQGILTNFGNLCEWNNEILTHKMINLISNLPLLNNQLNKQKQLVDGHSDKRLLNIFKRL